MVKLYEKFKLFIKENYKELIVYFIIMTICLYPLPYYIYTGGGIIDLDDKLSIEDECKEKGSFNLSYVKSVKGTIPTYLLSYVFDWDRESVSSHKIDESESRSDIWKREKMYLQESIDNAIISAYTLASEDLTIHKEVYKVLSIDKNALTNIKIGDEILEINSNKVVKYDDIKNIINECEVGEEVSIKVLRDDKEINCYAKVIEHESLKKMGVYLLKSYDYEYDRDIDIKFKSREGGSSGGFMLSLSIYNRLIPNDLTKGLKIVGTGTIDSDGNVGPIGGVKYKLRGAVKNKADIFFVPSENYQEAKDELDKKKYKIELVEVKTLIDAVNYLESR